jgi:thymidylate synthase ThyX
MNKINAKIIADSVNPQGQRITTMLLTYPRMIHAEVMTHRVFSRNSASSRAIPFKKMLQMVEDDPFIPIAWQKSHTGMQGTEYETDPKRIEFLREQWVESSHLTLNHAETIDELKITKQLTNRLLEPYMWHTILVTATEWENFFSLRCPQYRNPDSNLVWRSRKEFLLGECLDFSPYNQFGWFGINESQAEIHIQELAECMWDAYNESTPNILSYGKWHVPFGDKIDVTKLPETFEEPGNSPILDHYKIKISTARCARLSYMTFDGIIDYKKDITLHDQLLDSRHFSPFEHCARVMTEEEYSQFDKGIPRKQDDGTYSHFFVDIEQGWCKNFRGFIQYRFLIEK